MDKKYFFLAGTFRCGNSLLRSLLNQNPNLYVSPNSVLPEIFYRLFLIKEGTVFNEEKNHKAFDNVLKNIFNNYYSSYKQEYIIDQGRWGTPFNFKMLEDMKMLPAKFVVLIRPLNEILASWIKLEGDNIINIDSFCDDLMDEFGKVGQAYLSIKNLIDKKQNIHFIKYHDLCSEPEKQLKLLYEYLEIPFFERHYFKNLKDVENVINQTKIRKDKINIEKYDYNSYLPPNILDRFSEENNFFNKYSI